MQFQYNAHTHTDTHTYMHTHMHSADIVTLVRLKRRIKSAEYFFTKCPSVALETDGHCL